jgi:hypothetical protein
MRPFVAVLALLCIAGSSSAHAQAEQALTMPLPPKDVSVAKPQFMRLSSNQSPAQDVTLAAGIVKVKAFILPLIQSFGIGGRLAQVWFVPAYASLDGRIDIQDTVIGGMPFPDTTITIAEQDGLMDPVAKFRIGLVGAPALRLVPRTQWKPEFQLYAWMTVAMPLGQYDPTRRVNIGANRWAFQFGTPMVLPLSHDNTRPGWLEFTPSVVFYTANNEPFAGDKRTQDPLLKLEAHASHHFTTKVWASLDGGYQYGGKAAIDGVSTDVIINQLGLGVTVGYHIMSVLSAEVAYERLFFEQNKGYFWRVAVLASLPSKKDREEVKRLQEEARKKAASAQ